MTPGEKLTVAGLAVLLSSLGVLLGVIADWAAAPSVPPPPAASLVAVGEALARDDVGAADRAWEAAHAAASRTSSWRRLVALGDSAVRLGEPSGERGAYAARAREAYLAALVHARAEGSVEGVARVWRAFTALGEYDAAAHCAIIAEKLQARIEVTPVTSRSTRRGPDSRIEGTIAGQRRGP